MDIDWRGKTVATDELEISYVRAGCAGRLPARLA